MADETNTEKTSGKKSGDDPVKQSKSQALSPDEKHKNYLDDLERAHKESVVDALGNTPRAG